MSPRPKASLFVGRASFRRRRMRDAARVLPVLGAILLLLPLLRDGDPEATTSGMTLYYFGVWILLVAVAAFLAQQSIMADEDTGDRDGTGPAPDSEGGPEAGP